jgi:glycosyltransferase involved in cell wall biosynthesis
MRIGIDARLLQETGVGRYVRNLIRELSVLDKTNEYVIFLRKKSYQTFKVPNNRWTKRIADVPWHSLREQIILPWIFLREHVQILHIPYFNVPVLYPGKFIVTIHDLTILHFDTGKASTLPYWLYKIRRIGYRIILSVAISRASHIICVSETVKREIIAGFHKSPHSVSVTYEGVDPALLKKTVDIQNPIRGKYFLYVGNAYPHKNLEMLLVAYELYTKQLSSPQKLVCIGPDDYFYQKLKHTITSPSLARHIVFLHGLSDDVISILYRGATALLFPSRTEGFGLPAIEALALGCPVICSDIPVFHEILGDYATYINAEKPGDLATAMSHISSQTSRRNFTKDIVSRFDLHKMAEDTLTLYETS